MRTVSFAELGLASDQITDLLAQYWSRAQGRIFGVFEGVRRHVHAPVKYHLLSNAEVVSKIRGAWSAHVEHDLHEGSAPEDEVD